MAEDYCGRTRPFLARIGLARNAEAGSVSKLPPPFGHLPKGGGGLLPPHPHRHTRKIAKHPVHPRVERRAQLRRQISMRGGIVAVP